MIKKKTTDFFLHSDKPSYCSWRATRRIRWSEHEKRVGRSDRFLLFALPPEKTALLAIIVVVVDDTGTVRKTFSFTNPAFLFL